MTAIFDLEGTLVDTSEAQRAAYADIGVTVFRAQVVYPWETWLPGNFVPSMVGGSALDQAQSAHDRMNEALVRRMNLVRELPLATLARRLENFVVVTHHAHRFASTLLGEHLGIDVAGLIIQGGHSEQTKAQSVAMYGRRSEIGMYFDDSSQAIAAAREQLPSTWTCLHVTHST